ncbi:hypothetical protein BH09VER1_BH09VER1_41940 [soil metagenome]
MRSLNELSHADRVLILAPHPDDESLAAGGLIQKAVELGAEVRIIFASNGDNNPWPQRAAERRIRIGPEDGLRWGARRRVEAIDALAHLGVSADGGARFLEFPDRGFTDSLLRCEQKIVSALQREIEDFRPSFVVLPSPLDLHPDHSALAVLAQLALRRSATASEVLYYIVHDGGRDLVEFDISLRLTPAQQLKKREAILRHGSQMLLSRRRFLQFAKSEELYHRAGALGQSRDLHPIISAEVCNGGLEIRVGAPSGGRPRGSLLIAMESSVHGSIRYTLVVPERSGRVPVCNGQNEKPIRVASVRVRPREIVIRIPIAQCRPIDQVFLKYQTSSHFFDDSGWREIQVGAASLSQVQFSPVKTAQFEFPKLGQLGWMACAVLPLLWLIWAFTRNIAQPWIDVVGYNGAVWSQAAHNILRAGFAATQGASSGFYFGALPIPPGGFYLHHPPLLHLLLTLLFSLFGEHEWVARCLPIGASVLSGLFLWLLVSNCIGARVATFCLALFVCMPMELLYGQMVNFEPVILTLMLGGLLCLRYWRVTGNETWRWVAIGAFLAGLWVDWAMHIFVLTLCLSWLWRGESRNRRTAWYLIVATVFFGALHLVRIRLLRPDAWSDLAHTFFKRVGTQSNVPFTEVQWIERIFSNLSIHFISIAWILSVVGVAVILLRKARSEGYRFLGWTCLLITITDLLFLCIFQNDSFIHRYIAYYLIAPVSILGGIGLDLIFERLKGSPSSGGIARPLAAAALVLIFFCFSAYSGLFKSDTLRDQFRILDAQASEPPDLIPQLGETIRDNFAPKTNVLCNFLPNYGPQLGYYAQRTLVNNLLDYGSWRNFLRSDQQTGIGGVIWLDAANSHEIIDHLPPGTKKYLTIENLRFCIWKPLASNTTVGTRQISNFHEGLTHSAPAPLRAAPAPSSPKSSQIKST